MGFKENLKSELQYTGMTVRIAQALGVSVEYLVTGKDADSDSVTRYAPEVRKIADIAQAMDPYQRSLLSALIKAMGGR